MIKIIERGTRTVVRCNECGCKFSYEDEDVVHGCVTCPQCGVDIPHHRSSTCYSLDHDEPCIGGVTGTTGGKLQYLNLNGSALTTNKKQVLDIVDTQTMGVISTPTIGIVEPNTAGVINND